MWMLPLACAPEPPFDEAPSLASLTRACELALGPLPDIDCADGVEVPVPVTGPDGSVRLAVGPEDLEDGVSCDRPSPISGCVTGSRVGSLDTGRAVFHWICRRNDEATPPGLYDDIAMIGHDPETGAACFFGAPPDGRHRDGHLPRPGGPEDDGYWAELPELAAARCRDCHDADPIVVTPWIEATGVIDSDPLAPFVLIGESVLEALEPGWRRGPLWVHPDAAPCTGCHDLTSRFSCRLGAEATGTPAWRASAAGRAFPGSHWMDAFQSEELLRRYPTEAAWDEVFGGARSALLGCCSGELPAELCWDYRQ